MTIRISLGTSQPDLCSRLGVYSPIAEPRLPSTVQRQIKEPILPGLPRQLSIEMGLPVPVFLHLVSWILHLATIQPLSRLTASPPIRVTGSVHGHGHAHAHAHNAAMERWRTDSDMAWGVGAQRSKERSTAGVKSRIQMSSTTSKVLRMYGAVHVRQPTRTETGERPANATQRSAARCGTLIRSEDVVLGG